MDRLHGLLQEELMEWFLGVLWEIILLDEIKGTGRRVFYLKKRRERNAVRDFIRDLAELPPRQKVLGADLYLERVVLDQAYSTPVIDGCLRCTHTDEKVRIYGFLDDDTLEIMFWPESS